MGSMSRGYHDDQEKVYYERIVEEKCPTIVKCSCSTSTPIPALTIGIGLTGSVDLTLATLNVDTSCICDPNVKLDFTTNYIVPAGLLVGGTVSLQVFKQCRNQLTPTSVGQPLSLTGGILGVNTASIVSFFTCDSDICSNECCTYTVVATVNAVVSIALGASFNRSILSATITCRNSCHKCRRDYDRY